MMPPQKTPNGEIGEKFNNIILEKSRLANRHLDGFLIFLQYYTKIDYKISCLGMPWMLNISQNKLERKDFPNTYKTALNETIRRMLTCYEICIHHYYTETKEQVLKWLWRSIRKSVLATSWRIFLDAEGIVMIDYVLLSAHITYK